MEKITNLPLEPTPDYSAIDPRLLKKFLRISEFRQSLSPEQYSKAQFRIATARWAPEERIVYSAIQEGYSDTSSLPIATGLTTAQIQTALDSLVRRGALRITKVEETL
jgi:hypothetical protein